MNKTRATQSNSI